MTSGHPNGPGLLIAYTTAYREGEELYGLWITHIRYCKNTVFKIAFCRLCTAHDHLYNISDKKNALIDNSFIFKFKLSYIPDTA